MLKASRGVPTHACPAAQPWEPMSGPRAQLTANQEPKWHGWFGPARVPEATSLDGLCLPFGARAQNPPKDQSAQGRTLPSECPGHQGSRLWSWQRDPPGSSDKGPPREAEPRAQSCHGGHSAVRAPEKTQEGLGQTLTRGCAGSQLRDTPPTSPAAFRGHSGRERSHSQLSSLRVGTCCCWGNPNGFSLASEWVAGSPVEQQAWVAVSAQRRWACVEQRLQRRADHQAVQPRAAGRTTPAPAHSVPGPAPEGLPVKPPSMHFSFKDGETGGLGWEGPFGQMHSCQNRARVTVLPACPHQPGLAGHYAPRSPPQH